MADDINDPFHVCDSCEMTLQAGLWDRDMFFEYFDELFSSNIMQMTILFDPFLNLFLVVDQMFSQIRKIIKGGFVKVK